MKDHEVSKSILIKNLNERTTTRDLSELCKPFGELLDVYIPHQRRNGAPNQYAFVEFVDSDAVQTAADALNGTELLGNELSCKIARTKRKEPVRPRNGSFRRGRRDSYRGFQDNSRRNDRRQDHDRRNGHESREGSDSFMNGRSRYDRRSDAGSNDRHVNYKRSWDSDYSRKRGDDYPRKRVDRDENYSRKRTDRDENYSRKRDDRDEDFSRKRDEDFSRKRDDRDEDFSRKRDNRDEDFSRKIEVRDPRDGYERPKRGENRGSFDNDEYDDRSGRERGSSRNRYRDRRRSLSRSPQR